VSGHSYRSLVSLARGRLDGALRSARAGVALADRLGHPLSRVFARHFMAMARILRDEPSAALAVADEQLSLATAHGFSLWGAGPIFLRGTALARLRTAREGAPLMERGIAALRTTGAQLAIPIYLTMLGETYATAGRLDDVDAVLTEARTLADETGQLC